MTRRPRRIGFDRHIQLDWLEEAARLVDQGLGAPDINSWLENFLEDRIRGKVSRRKTRNVVVGVWSDIPGEIIPFRDDGLKLLKRLKGRERLSVHWGMAVAAYPFFAFLVQQIGRLHKLQPEITMRQVRRRVVERFGDTHSVHRAAGRLIQSLCAWDVLTSKSNGAYGVTRPVPLKNTVLLSWIAEAGFYSRSSDSLPFEQMNGDPMWFPFSIDIKTNDLGKNPRLELFRQGLDDDVVLLKKKR